MNRRIRSFSGLRRRAVTRASLLALALGLAACSSDLFHDTKWQSRCDTEPDAAICPQGTGGAGASTTSSTSDGSSTSSASSVSSSGSSGGSSPTSTTGAGGAASTSTGTSMMASTSTGP